MKFVQFIFATLCIFGQSNHAQLLLGLADAPTIPVDSPGAGTYGSTQSVTITDATATAIYYTLDGSTPGCPATGTLYTGAFNISSTTTLKAIGCNGINGGTVLTSVYTISSGILLVTHGFAQGSTATTSALNTTGATLIIVACNGASGGFTGPTSSPSAGTFSALTSQSGTNQGERIFYLYSPSTSSSQTFTCPPAQVTRASVWVEVFSGTSGSTVDQQNGVINNTGTAGTLQPGSVTPQHNNEVVVTFVSWRETGTPISINDSFTLTDSGNFLSSNYYGGGLAYLVQTTAAAVNPTWTFTADPSDMTATIGTFQ